MTRALALGHIREDDWLHRGGPPKSRPVENQVVITVDYFQGGLRSRSSSEASFDRMTPSSGGESPRHGEGDESASVATDDSEQEFLRGVWANVVRMPYRDVRSIQSRSFNPAARARRVADENGRSWLGRLLSACRRRSPGPSVSVPALVWRRSSFLESSEDLEDAETLEHEK